jgi:polyribonucleotide 5'-hydroxyl-kinase
MIVGAVDSGKSSLCSMLCNWASRQGEHVIYVDLDVGQGNIVVPGMLAAVPLDTPVEIHV